MEKTFQLPLHKRVLKHPLFQDFITWVIAIIMKMCWLSYRVERRIHPDSLPYLQGTHNGIFCFWHGRMILFPFFKPSKRAMYVLISFHRDGELIAKVIRHFSIQTIRGSSNKGARVASRQLLDQLKAGDNISITPDGPRGPIFQAEKGAILLARLADKPLIPVSFSAQRVRRLPTWDRFMIPLPFSRLLVIADAPLFITQQDSEAQRLELEQRLNQITNQADIAMKV